MKSRWQSGKGAAGMLPAGVDRCCLRDSAGLDNCYRIVNLLPASYVFRGIVTPAAPTCSLPLSVHIVAGRDDFAERGSVSRSTWIATEALGRRQSSCGSQTRAPLVAA